MELKVDNTTKILLGAIALGLFLNASNIFIDKAYANDWDVGRGLLLCYRQLRVFHVCAQLLQTFPGQLYCPMDYLWTHSRLPWYFGDD